MGYQEQFEKQVEKEREEEEIWREVHEGEEGNKKIIEEQIEELKNSDEWFEKIKYRAKEGAHGYDILYDVVTPFTDSFRDTLEFEVGWNLKRSNSEAPSIYSITASWRFSEIYSEVEEIMLKYGIYYGIVDPEKKDIFGRLSFDFDDKKKTREAFRRVLLVALESENEFLERSQKIKHNKRIY